MDTVSLLVYASGAVIGSHPGVSELPQDFASIVLEEGVGSCVARYMVEADDPSDAGQGSFLVTATLSCLGLTARPGATIAYCRASTDGQASALYHQAVGDAAAPHGADTAVVPGWPGRGWVHRARYLTLPVAPGSPTPSRTDRPVCAALRDLGVRRGDSADEADALGLTLPPLPLE